MKRETVEGETYLGLKLFRFYFRLATIAIVFYFARFLDVLIVWQKLLLKQILQIRIIKRNTELHVYLRLLSFIKTKLELKRRKKKKTKKTL